MQEKENRFSKENKYVYVRMPGHPVANEYGYCSEHRMVAWDEGILTDLTCVVHHKNGLKWDNRPENLEAMTASEHCGLHAKDPNRWWDSGRIDGAPYKSKEVARLLGVGKKTVERSIRAGRIKGFKIGKYWYVTEKVFEQLKGELPEGLTNETEQQ